MDAARVLRVNNLYCARVRDVSFELKKGDVLGFSGLTGAGRTAVFEAICGLAHIDSGQILVDEKEVRFATVAAARDVGIGYLTQRPQKPKG